MLMTRRDECPNCGARYWAEVGYDDEALTERDTLPCACGSVIFCQDCRHEDATECAYDGCSVLFCDSCAAGSDLEGDLYCAAHVPPPTRGYDAIAHFAVALERFANERASA